jgi:hypothetical protein
MIKTLVVRPEDRVNFKTLVIHPQDHTTDFLCGIYKDKGWDVMKQPIKRSVIEAIPDYERIVMLGHGTPDGLFGKGGFVVDQDTASVLEEKDCVSIWCYADLFMQKHNLKGFATGMFISDEMEAMYYGVAADEEQIKRSNEYFSSIVNIAIDSRYMTELVRTFYRSSTNTVIDYNNSKIARL